MPPLVYTARYFILYGDFVVMHAVVNIERSTRQIAAVFTYILTHIVFKLCICRTIIGHLHLVWSTEDAFFQKQQFRASIALPKSHV